MSFVLDESVRTRIYDHVFGSLQREVGGVLLGPSDGDRDLHVTACIEALEAENREASVTFTHESWAGIYARLEDHPGLGIVGWYHSHPGFGIFLSDYDLFIHRSFFTDERQVAYVVDPRQGREGVFGWRGGEIAKLDETDTARPPVNDVGRAANGETQPAPAHAARRNRGLSLGVAGLLVGLLAGAAVGVLVSGGDEQAPARPPQPSTRVDPDPRVPGLEAEVAQLRTARGEMQGSMRFRHHTLRRGETLSDVADHYYGDPARAWLVAGANGIEDLNRVPAGARLVVPPRRLADASRDGGSD